MSRNVFWICLSDSRLAAVLIGFVPTCNSGEDAHICRQKPCFHCDLRANSWRLLSLGSSQRESAFTGKLQKKKKKSYQSLSLKNVNTGLFVLLQSRFFSFKPRISGIRQRCSI